METNNIKSSIIEEDSLSFGNTMIKNAKNFAENHSEEEYQKYLEELSLEFSYY